MKAKIPLSPSLDARPEASVRSPHCSSEERSVQKNLSVCPLRKLSFQGSGAMAPVVSTGEAAIWLSSPPTTAVTPKRVMAPSPVSVCRWISKEVPEVVPSVLMSLLVAPAS